MTPAETIGPDRIAHLIEVAPIGIDDFSALRYLYAKSLIAQTAALGIRRAGRRPDPADLLARLHRPGDGGRDRRRLARRRAGRLGRLASGPRARRHRPPRPRVRAPSALRHRPPPAGARWRRARTARASASSPPGPPSRPCPSSSATATKSPRAAPRPSPPATCCPSPSCARTWRKPPPVIPEAEAPAPRLSGTSHVESLEVPALDDFALCAQIVEAGMTGQSLVARRLGRAER